MRYLLIMVILPLFMANCITIKKNLIEEAALFKDCMYICEENGMKLSSLITDSDAMLLGCICEEK